jgi:putative methionine-R-sulfoxide reductase with GAF domain
MARVTLRNVIGPRQDSARLVEEIAGAIGTPVAVEDAEGRLLYGARSTEGGARHPIALDGTSVGWVSGEPPARVLATLLEHLLSKEAERKALGAEVLHLYREVNLIYSFSEKLAAMLDLDRVARLTLQEARQLIAATDGAIMLLDEQTGTLSTLAGFGGALPHLTGFERGKGVIGSIAASGIAEIVNDVASDPRRVRDGTAVHALMCAPLKVGERVIGVIALGSATPAAYTAAELKLLNTLALQTATAIENARLFQRTVQAAREREELLAAKKEMEVARAKLEREFELAASIQADLFPAAMPRLEGLDLAARNRPARRCVPSAPTLSRAS